ncbi:hypothetical protein Ancab_032739 [Ancistrocladus abbreviatus]
MHGKMMEFIKLRRSRGGAVAAAVHHHQSDSEEAAASNNKKFIDSNEEEELGGPCTSLTVWRKSLLYCCTGFTVFALRVIWFTASIVTDGITMRLFLWILKENHSSRSSIIRS